MDIGLGVLLNILELCMTNTYGSMSKFCTVFSYKSEASAALLECFLELLSFMDVSFRTTIFAAIF